MLRSTRNRQGNQGNQQQGQQSQGYDGPGVVTNIATFQHAIQGEMLDGQPVRIIATGNVPGFSPGYLVIDEEGESTWVPLAETQVTDPNFLPVKVQTLSRQKRDR